ncbi:hypothetical protein QIS74_13647 [Colletotrichum tabaci]|uniref:Uncharacterized protein n=1 Tax=Colletotrichum tabaci TaxID=1209068 RepID=A0AAV9SSN2_9PEZI
MDGDDYGMAKSDREYRITPDKPYNFTLKTNASDNTTNVDWLTCSVVVEESLNARDKHLYALDQVPKAKKLYKPGVWVIPEYNVEFLLVVSDHLKNFQLPSDIKVRLWWSSEEGDTIFRAHLFRQFRHGMTGPDAVVQTTPGRNLEEHCQTLGPDDPQTANVIYLVSPRAVNECKSLRHLLSPQAKALIAQEDEDQHALSRACQLVVDQDSRRAWEDGLEYVIVKLVGKAHDAQFVPMGLEQNQVSRFSIAVQKVANVMVCVNLGNQQYTVSLSAPRFRKAITSSARSA